MKPGYMPAVRFRYFNDCGVTHNSRTYDYIVPPFINPYFLKPGEHVVVHSAGSDKPEVCEIEEVMHHGSAKATKPIIGTANLPGLAIIASRRRQRDELLAKLAAREREVRYARLAQADAEAASLYAQLAALGEC